MTVEDLLPRLEAVRRISRGYVARCPAHHPDKNPSLAVREGDRGILVRCWAGCELSQITAALGLSVRDLFFDTEPDPGGRREARERHERTRKELVQIEAVAGFTIDALREAEYFIMSRRGLDISSWTHGMLDEELNALADAYQLLECEAING